MKLQFGLIAFAGLIAFTTAATCGRVDDDYIAEVCPGVVYDTDTVRIEKPIHVY